jgi:glycosyltransferase involved in cell wall biosynthesis
MNDNIIATVLMPVYNGGKFIKEAIDSILGQTFRDFELLIVNDGSIDNSEEIIKSYHDPRIHLLTNKNNLGLIASLNVGLRAAKGHYIARMDQDDISMPDRLERQINYLNAHPDVGLLGTTYAIKIGEVISSIAAVLLDHQDLCYQLLYKSPFGHGTVMFRHELQNKLQGQWYSPSAENAEDYDLWSRIALITKIANLPEVLYIWRDNPAGISSSRQLLQQKKRLEIARRNQCDPKYLSNLIKDTQRSVDYRNEKVELFDTHYRIERKNNYFGMCVKLFFIFTHRLKIVSACKQLRRILGILASYALNPKTS